MRVFVCLLVSLLFGIAACGGVTSGSFDANRNPDGNANPDGEAVTAVPPSKEIVPAAGRVSGGGFTVDVELGNWHKQSPVTGGGTTVEGAAPVKR